MYTFLTVTLMWAINLCLFVFFFSFYLSFLWCKNLSGLLPSLPLLLPSTTFMMKHCSKRFKRRLFLVVSLVQTSSASLKGFFVDEGLNVRVFVGDPRLICHAFTIWVSFKIIKKEVFKGKWNYLEHAGGLLCSCILLPCFVVTLIPFLSFSRKINQNILETACPFESIKIWFVDRKAQHFPKNKQIIKKDDMIYSHFFSLLRIHGLFLCISHPKFLAVEKSVEREEALCLWVTNCRSWQSMETSQPCCHVDDLLAGSGFISPFSLLSRDSITDTATNQAVLHLRKTRWVFHICQRFI